MVYQYRHKRNGIIDIYTKEMLSQYWHKRNCLSTLTQKKWSINIDTKDTKEMVYQYRNKRNGLSVSTQKTQKKWSINIDTKEMVYRYPRMVATKNEERSEKLLVYHYLYGVRNCLCIIICVPAPVSTGSFVLLRFGTPLTTRQLTLSTQRPT